MAFIYTDSSCILDVRFLVSAETFECEHGPHDGQCGIGVYLRAASPTEKLKRTAYLYSNKGTRDAAFLQIGVLLQQLQEAPLMTDTLEE